MKRIYVDMDDTLCDFRGAYQRDRYGKYCTAFPQSQHNFFRTLQPINGAVHLVKAIAELGYDVWILTRPSTINRLCYTEKADWVFEHLGQEWVDKLILCPDKSLLKGDLLIDDVSWPGFEGKQILFGSTEFPHWNDVYEAVKYNFKEF